MGRVFLLVLVILLSVGIPVLCGFTLLEAIIIFILGVFWIGFLGWMLRKCKSSMIRCVLFWFLSIILDKPELLYPNS